MGSFSLIPGVNWGLHHTSYPHLISFVIPDDFVSYFVTIILKSLIKERHVPNMAGVVFLSVWVKKRAGWIIDSWPRKCSYLFCCPLFTVPGAIVCGICIFASKTARSVCSCVHFLPGQGVMLHSWYSCAGPRQVWPPYLGSGLLQVLLRLRIPRLQSRLHWDQELQDDQPPFTVWPEILPRRSTSPVSYRESRQNE